MVRVELGEVEYAKGLLGKKTYMVVVFIVHFLVGGCLQQLVHFSELTTAGCII